VSVLQGKQCLIMIMIMKAMRVCVCTSCGIIVSYRIKNYIEMRDEKVTVDGRNVSYVHINVQCFIRSGGRFWQIFVSVG